MTMDFDSVLYPRRGQGATERSSSTTTSYAPVGVPARSTRALDH